MGPSKQGENMRIASIQNLAKLTMSNVHPWKLTAADPKNPQIEKEKHLQNLPFWVPWCSMLIFWGDMLLSTIWIFFGIAWMAKSKIPIYQSQKLPGLLKWWTVKSDWQIDTDSIWNTVHRIHSLWDKVIYCLSPTYETTSWIFSLGCLQKSHPPKVVCSGWAWGRFFQDKTPRPKPPINHFDIYPILYGC